MADKTVRILQCDCPDCLTPEDNVKRVEIVIDRRKVVVDLCADDRKAIEHVMRFAHRKPRGRGIQVVDPQDIPSIRKR